MKTNFLVLTIICLSTISCSKKDVQTETTDPVEFSIPKTKDVINIVEGVDTLVGGYLGPIYLIYPNIKK